MPFDRGSRGQRPLENINKFMSIIFAKFYKPLEKNS
jgi:hypothetical protein